MTYNPSNFNTINIHYYLFSTQKNKRNFKIIYTQVGNILTTINLTTKKITLDFDNNSMPTNSISITYAKYEQLLKLHKII